MDGVINGEGCSKQLGELVLEEGVDWDWFLKPGVSESEGCSWQLVEEVESDVCIWLIIVEVSFGKGCSKQLVDELTKDGLDCTWDLELAVNESEGCSKQLGLCIDEELRRAINSSMNFCTSMTSVAVSSKGKKCIGWGGTGNGGTSGRGSRGISSSESSPMKNCSVFAGRFFRRA